MKPSVKAQRLSAIAATPKGLTHSSAGSVSQSSSPRCWRLSSTRHLGAVVDPQWWQTVGQFEREFYELERTNHEHRNPDTRQQRLGKSTSLRNLDPAKTLVIQCIKKPLPFRAPGWKVRENLRSDGNVIRTDDPALIEKIMRNRRTRSW